MNEERIDGASSMKGRPDVESLKVHAAQVRAARALLGWSQAELSRRSGLAKRSIANLELAATRPYGSTLRILKRTFTDAGVAYAVTGRRIQVTLNIDASRGASVPIADGARGDACRTSPAKGRREGRTGLG